LPFRPLDNSSYLCPYKVKVTSNQMKYRMKFGFGSSRGRSSYIIYAVKVEGLYPGPARNTTVINSFFIYVLERELGEIR
jgi:hypothetical protein